MQIRKARVNDSSAVSKILLKAFLPFRAFYTKQAFNATIISAETVVQRMTEGEVFLATYNERPIGTVSVLFKEDGCNLKGMAVLPEAQGMKVGYNLLRLVEDVALDNGMKRLYLCTTPFLLSAIHLYKRFGFDKIGDHFYDFFGTQIFSMEKLLKNPGYESH